MLSIFILISNILLIYFWIVKVNEWKPVIKYLIGTKFLSIFIIIELSIESDVNIYPPYDANNTDFVL